MRVIAGKARRISLTTPEGFDTRPTTDRIKETLFNMIQSDLADARFLDLFSGSGAIAIEAVSRGAKEAVLVEKDTRALRALEENLKRTNLCMCCSVLAMDFLDALNKIALKKDAFDLIFMDPPYDMGYERRVLEYLIQSPLLHTETIIIYEASKKTEETGILELGYNIERIKEYKTNKHVFLKKR